MKGRSVRSDAELIQECRTGHLDAFRLLVERYQVEAFAHALSLMGNREDALESVQDALVSAWRAIDRFDVSRPFYPWLYVILRNRCYRNLESRSRRGEVDSVDFDLCQLVTAPDESTAREVEDGLRALGPDEREII
ncbi:MAG: sigma-70 family RNA polymerase sigma factor, partial [Planctomycetes bacterium]|nr:sigma-70 family RNA polymerase sigma factor [Planctomycetota bacterium]